MSCKVYVSLVTTLKPVINDHLYDTIAGLLFISSCDSVDIEVEQLTEKYHIRWSL